MKTSKLLTALKTKLELLKREKEMKEVDESWLSTYIGIFCICGIIFFFGWSIVMAAPLLFNKLTTLSTRVIIIIAWFVSALAIFLAISELWDSVRERKIFKQELKQLEQKIQTLENLIECLEWKKKL